MTEQDLEDLARVAYAKVEGCELPWEQVDQRRQKTIRRMAAAVQMAVLGQFPELAEQPQPACAHDFQPALEWRVEGEARVGRQSPICRTCGLVRRADFGEKA